MVELATSAAEDGIDLSAAPPPVDDVHQFFRWFLYDNPQWFDHVASFWEHQHESNVLFVHYDDLKSNLRSQMQRVATFLGIAVDDARWDDIVERCTFDGMKRRSAEIHDFDAHFIGGADAFMFKGTNGRWRDVLTTDELSAFDCRLRELLPDDAVKWTQFGAG
jgi:aryl sulfotransferase